MQAVLEARRRATYQAQAPPPPQGDLAPRPETIAGTDGPRSPPCFVLGRPRTTGTRAPCVLAWRRLGHVISSLSFPGGPLSTNSSITTPSDAAAGIASSAPSTPARF